MQQTHQNNLCFKNRNIKPIRALTSNASGHRPWLFRGKLAEKFENGLLLPLLLVSGEPAGARAPVVALFTLKNSPAIRWVCNRDSVAGPDLYASEVSDA